MEINKYMIFLEVAKQKNLSRAAENLGYTQSGISHTLKRLESEMNLTLFDRSRNGASLTAAGQELYPYITDLVQCQTNLDQAILSLHNLHKGTLNIGAYSSISRQWLPEIIQKFRHDFPSIKIHFKEGGNGDILRWLDHNEVDFGFFSIGSEENLHGEDFPYEWIPLVEDPLLAVLPKDYPIHTDYFALDEFNDQTFIISALGTDVDIHRTLEENQIHPDVQYSAIDDLTIISMVACNLGISILPGLMLKGQDEKVLTLPLKPFAKRQLGIAIPSLKMASPATLEFINYTKEYVKSQSV